MVGKSLSFCRRSEVPCRGLEDDFSIFFVQNENELLLLLFN